MSESFNIIYIIIKGTKEKPIIWSIFKRQKVCYYPSSWLDHFYHKLFCFAWLHDILFDRSRSRSRSRSPSSRRHTRGTHAESNYRSKAKPPRVEYITEFGGSEDASDLKVTGISPPSSPIRADIPNRSGNLTFNICKKIQLLSFIQCSLVSWSYYYLKSQICQD